MATEAEKTANELRDEAAERFGQRVLRADRIGLVLLAMAYRDVTDVEAVVAACKRYHAVIPALARVVDVAVMEARVRRACGVLALAAKDGGFSTREIGRVYAVDGKTVHRIVTGNGWRSR